MRLLEETVATGAKLYNSGKEKDCEKLYRSAMSKIVENAGSDIPASTVEILRLSLKRSKDIERHEEPCWVLRQGIDLAYYSLEQAGRGSKVSSGR